MAAGSQYPASKPAYQWQLSAISRYLEKLAASAISWRLAWQPARICYRARGGPSAAANENLAAAISAATA